jgi:hypothetical protein
LEGCATGYALLIIIELIVRKRWLRIVLEVVSGMAVLVLALLVNNAVTGRVSFGEGASPVATVAIMFVCTVLGVVARYVFYVQKGAFSWLDLLKPIAISPLVLLPLIGSVQATGEPNQMQIVSFAILAFQNGFFWQAVLQSAKPSTQH